jgi:hypothetical protein
MQKTIVPAADVRSHAILYLKESIIGPVPLTIRTIDEEGGEALISNGGISSILRKRTDGDWEVGPSLRVQNDVLI